MLSSKSLLLAVLAAVAYAHPQRTTYTAAPTATLPDHCTTTTGPTVSTHSCFSYTTQVTPSMFFSCIVISREAQTEGKGAESVGMLADICTSIGGGCPREECPPETEPVFCPLIIVESTVTAPCSTDCCPTTGTTTVTTSCPKPCEKCPIPTNYYTVTAECPASY